VSLIGGQVGGDVMEISHLWRPYSTNAKAEFRCSLANLKQEALEQRVWRSSGRTPAVSNVPMR
jgi:hypothetical protein